MLHLEDLRLVYNDHGPYWCVYDADGHIVFRLPYDVVGKEIGAVERLLSLLVTVNNSAYNEGWNGGMAEMQAAMRQTLGFDRDMPHVVRAGARNIDRTSEALSRLEERVDRLERK